MMRAVAFALLAHTATVVALKPIVPRSASSNKGNTLREASPLVDSVPSSNVEQITSVATDLALTGMRVGTCALMIHHGIDKIEVRSCRKPSMPV